MQSYFVVKRGGITLTQQVCSAFGPVSKGKNLLLIHPVTNPMQVFFSPEKRMKMILMIVLQITMVWYVLRIFVYFIITTGIYYALIFNN